jgi:hypothetical protein
VRVWSLRLSSIGRTTITTVGSPCNKGVTSYKIGVGLTIDENQTMVFRDGVEQWETGIASGWESTRDVAMTDNPTFEDFFARPVVYNLPTWTPGQAAPYTSLFNPWQIFFSDKRVANRLSNFNLAQTTLKVKFLINGNAFYYGRLMADYVPLYQYNTVDTLNTLNPNSAIQASQRLKLFLNPTTSQGGTLSLPFLWHNNAIGLTSNDVTLLGEIYVRELSGLKHANAGLDPVSIQAYIWADNMRLSVPTTTDAYFISPQGRDEYGTGPVSGVAFSVAKAAGKLENVPMIGPYAKATGMVASGLGTIAKAFGYSRVSIIDDPTNMHPRIVGALANTNVGDPSMKLTIDAKQELCIDPTTVGITMPDELVIKEIATRESYITQFPWAISAVRGQRLWSTQVGPLMTVNDTSFTIPMTWAPAIAFSALPFQWWRGTMRYRFQIICSEYHKGRLRFVYDPNSIQSLEANIAQSRIIDLANERDFVMDISWGQPTPFLPVSAMSFGTGVTTPGGNGVLGVYVENDLTSPNSTVNNDITINVFVSGCDDIEFAVPNATAIENLTYSVQSSDEPALETDNAPVKEEQDDEIMSCLKVDNTYDVFYGESITSFRQLLKRYNYHSSVLAPTTAAGFYTWTIADRDFPRYRGKFSDAINIPVTGAVSINNAKLTMLNYLTPAYVGYRGGIRWKYLLSADSVTGTTFQRVYRNNDRGGSYTSTVVVKNVSTVALFSQTQATALSSLQAGGEVTYTRNQPALEFETPYYEPYRFSMAKGLTLAGYGPTYADLVHIISTDLRVTTTGYYDRYCAAGEDFTLFLFNGMPPYRTIDLTV